MRGLLRYRPSPAMVVALVALFVAMSAGAAANLPGIGVVNSGDIKNNTVRSKDIRNRNIRGKDVRKNTIGGVTIKESSLKQVPDAAHADNADTATTATTANSLLPPEAYREIGSAGNPPFQNGAANFGGTFTTAAFFKDREGVVHFKGTITAGNTTVFTLPAGYRPPQDTFSVIKATGSFGRMTVRASTGAVELSGPAATNNYGIDDQSYRAVP